MKIDHISLYVRDLESMRAFYQTFFGATADSKYHNPRTGLSTCFLSFESGARLELMHRADAIDEEKPLARNGFIHLAFAAGSQAAVVRLTERLRAAGYGVISGPRTTGDGYFESCVLDPEQNQIEITV